MARLHIKQPAERNTMATVQKIAEAMKSVGHLSKDKKLSGGGSYEYLSEEKISAFLHNVFADLGLIVAPIHYEIIENREDTTRNGGILHNVRVRATFRFTDGEDFLDVMSLGEGSDSGDKAVNKAMTGAYKYALRQSMLISTGDDPDAYAGPESVAAGYQAPAPEPPASQPAPPSRAIQRLANRPADPSANWLNRLAELATKAGFANLQAACDGYGWQLDTLKSDANAVRAAKETLDAAIAQQAAGQGATN
jgi:ERF superfamily